MLRMGHKRNPVNLASRHLLVNWLDVRAISWNLRDKQLPYQNTVTSGLESFDAQDVLQITSVLAKRSTKISGDPYVLIGTQLVHNVTSLLQYHSHVSDIQYVRLSRSLEMVHFISAVAGAQKEPYYCSYSGLPGCAVVIATRVLKPPGTTGILQ